jgi:hypothetical protein
MPQDSHRGSLESRMYKEELDRDSRRWESDNSKSCKKYHLVQTHQHMPTYR